MAGRLTMSVGVMQPSMKSQHSEELDSSPAQARSLLMSTKRPHLRYVKWQGGYFRTFDTWASYFVNQISRGGLAEGGTIFVVGQCRLGEEALSQWT